MKQIKTNGEIPSVPSATDLTPVNNWTECHKEIQAFHFLMHSIAECPYCLSPICSYLTPLPTTEIYTAGVKEFITPTDGAAGFQTTRSLYPRAEVDVRKWVVQKSTAWYKKKRKAKGKAKEGEKVGTEASKTHIPKSRNWNIYSFHCSVKIQGQAERPLWEGKEGKTRIGGENEQTTKRSWHETLQDLNTDWSYFLF